MKPNMGALLSVGSCDCRGHTPMKLILTQCPLLNESLALTTAYANDSKYPFQPTHLCCAPAWNSQQLANIHSGTHWCLGLGMFRLDDPPPSTPPKSSFWHSQIQGTATLSTQGPIAEAVLALEPFSPCISRKAAIL